MGLHVRDGRKRALGTGLTDTRPLKGCLEPPDTVSRLFASPSRPRVRSLGTENDFQRDAKCETRLRRAGVLRTIPGGAGSAQAPHASRQPAGVSQITDADAHPDQARPYLFLSPQQQRGEKKRAVGTWANTVPGGNC